MRVIGVDLGTRRVGLAVSDPTGTIAMPAAVLENTGKKKVLETLAEAAKAYEAGAVVIGHPINMDGSIGPKAREAEEYAEALRQETGLEVVLWDERLSSVQAMAGLEKANVKKGKRKKLVDRVAAQIVLQSYLDSRGRENHED